MQVGDYRSVTLAALASLFVAACSSNTIQPEPRDGPPRATVLVFSDLRGTLKPCGCSPDLRRGGVARITKHVASVRASTPGAVILHAGDLLVDDEGILGREAQVERRATAVADSLSHIDVAAATLGPHDVAQGLDWLEKNLPQVKVPIVVTNVSGERWRKLTQKHLIITVDGVRLGVIGLLPKGAAGASDPLEAVQEAAGELRKQGADLILVLSSLGLRRSKRLLRKDTGVDLLLAAGQDLKAVVTGEVEPMQKGWLFQSFVQGGQIGRLDIALNGSKSVVHVEPTAAPPDGESWFTYNLTAINWDLPQDPKVMRIMRRYDKDLKEINLAAAGTLPPLAEGQASYVGVTKCFECHEETRAFWKQDRHRDAWNTLVKDGKTFDLECVSCHATGYGKAGGSILGDMKNLADVQCEECHGPGSLHSEEGAALETLRKAVPETVCVTCHNPKHSTGFNYKKYRSRLLVPGHGIEGGAP